MLRGTTLLTSLPLIVEEIGNEYLCMMAELGMQPITTGKTREDSCLDHVFIKGKPAFTQGVIAMSDITDHSLVMMGMSTNSSAINQQKNGVVIKTDYKAIANDLRSADWSDILDEHDDVDRAVERFQDIITAAIRKHSYTKRMNRSQNVLKPWITPGLIRCMIHRDRLHLDMRRNPKDEAKAAVYRRYRNFCNNLLHRLKQEHESSNLEANKRNPKKLWKSIRSIIETPKHRSTATELLNCKQMPLDAVNHCNQYFANVGNQLAHQLLEKLGKTETELAEEIARHGTHPAYSFFLHPTDEFEVARIIDKMKKDSAPGRDGIKPALIKDIKFEILAPLTHIFNISLSTGTFPQQWKIACITPIHKKGPKNLPENYRPISLLATFSKLLEKVVNHRLVTYLEKFNMLSESQFGFRGGKSTEDAVELLYRRVSETLDSGKKSIGIFLDLAKAFDTISVEILLKKLELTGIRGLPLKWFESYLGHRNQSVKIGECISDTLTSSFGVPQGSVLGPTFFILYMNDIHEVDPVGTELICYADDTVAIFNGRTWKEAFKKAETGMAKVKSWLDSNLLTLNMSKTKYVCFHITKATEPNPPHSLRIHSFCTLSNCNCDTISRSQTITYLGITIDENLSFKAQISTLGARVRKLIYVVKALRNSANRKTLHLVYTALCESILSYCITTWGGAGSTAMMEVERAQRAVLKVMYKRPYRYPTDDIYAEAGVMSVRQIYIQRVTLLVHRNKNNFSFSQAVSNRRPMNATLTRVRTVFAQRFPNFSYPFIYNILNKKCNIIDMTFRETKANITKFLMSLTYTETEELLTIVK